MLETNFVYCLNAIKDAIRQKKSCEIKLSSQYRNLTDSEKKIINNMYKSSFSEEPNKYVDPRNWFLGEDL